MPRRYSRSQRVGDLIQTELAQIIQQEDLGISMITITDVDVSPDFSHARVYVSVLEDDEAKIKEAITTLNEHAKQFRYLLAQAVKMRVTPDLKFFFDDSTQRGTRIDSLLHNAFKTARNK